MSVLLRQAEIFERTRDERLIPALGEVEGAAPPNIGLNPVYKLITA